MEKHIGTVLAARRSDVLVVCACTNLRKASRIVTQRFDAALKPCGLRATQLSLLLACGAEEVATIAGVAEVLAVDRTTLTRTLRPLVRQGLILTQRGPDRRTQHITMTDHGRETLAAALPLWATAEREVAEDLGWNELKSLLAGLARVVATKQEN